MRTGFFLGMLFFSIIFIIFETTIGVKVKTRTKEPYHTIIKTEIIDNVINTDTIYIYKNER